jgi:hypothetical protein
VLPDRDVARLARWLDAVRGPRRSQDLATGTDECDAAVIATEAPPPHPGDLAERAQLVEQSRLVARDPGWQHVSFQDRGRDREPGELVDDLGEAFEGGRPAQGRPRRSEGRHALPLGQETAQRGRVDRLDLAPQARERAPAEEPKHLGIAPLALRATGPEFATQQRAGTEQALQRVADHADRKAPATGRVGRQERTVAASPA